MVLNISKPVGDVPGNGSPNANMFDDVLIVQFLLNRSPGPGKPDPPLPQDGAVTPQFIAAIRDYESTRGAVDGRIDPGDATMVALNAVALPEFEGVTDFLERRSIILRVNPEWNFTRGDYKTLTDIAGLSLRFDASSIWLPNALKTRMLAVFDRLLKPAEDPAPTWGVSTLDWYHCHLGLWSGAENKQVSAVSQAWALSAVEHREALWKERRPFISLGEIPVENIPLFQAAYSAWVLRPEIAILLNSFADLPEGVIIHHTFEDQGWRPDMKSSDPRRNWMVDVNGVIHTPPYRSMKALNAANARNDFICELTIQINFLIDKSGVIHPVLGFIHDLALVTGLRSSSLLPPPSIFPLELDA